MKERSALIVESDRAQAESIAEVLTGLHYRCAMVGTAEEAISHFNLDQPEIVFVAIDLPGTDGFETADQIKSLAGDRFAPVMMLAHERDDALLLRCVESGADDFLIKPVEATRIQARILVMERVRELQTRLAERRADIAARLERNRAEEEFAERVLSRAVTAPNVVMERLGLLQRSAAIFSGDIVLTQHLPDGSLRLLVGDFTGHGLAAAVAALPVADTFHAMTLKGASDVQLLAELNRKLYQLLPTDRFMGAILVTIPVTCTELRWWNGGMPSGWLRTSAGLRELRAHALPLGILQDLPADEVPRRVRVTEGDRLLLMTDGLLEANDAQGRMLLSFGFEDVLREWPFGASVLPALTEVLDRHTADVEQADDIAIIEVPVDPRLFVSRVATSLGESSNGWGFSVTFEGDRLKDQLSVESMLSPLGLVDDVRPQMNVLETIFTELYSNAVEHGVLKLDSSLKATADGFDDFYRERARRFSDGCDGRVSVCLRFEPTTEGGCVRLTVCDSGDGFSEQNVMDLTVNSVQPWGRGIPLLKNLCESVQLKGNGSEVEVVYRW